MMIWRKYWRSLFLIHLVVYLLPALVVVPLGIFLGIFPADLLDALRMVLLDQTASGRPFWTEPDRTSAWVLVGLGLLLMTIVVTAGKLGGLRAIVHEGRAPAVSDFVSGIRLYGVRLALVKLLSLVVLGVAFLAALLTGFVAKLIFADWLLLIIILAVVLAGAGAVIYAEIILVVEEGSAPLEAISDSVDVLTGRWQEALSAAIIFGLIIGIGELSVQLLASVKEPYGLLLSVLISAVVGGIALIYLTLRYIENVHHRLFSREGTFALERELNE